MIASHSTAHLVLSRDVPPQPSSQSTALSSLALAVAAEASATWELRSDQPAMPSDSTTMTYSTMLRIWKE